MPKAIGTTRALPQSSGVNNPKELQGFEKLIKKIGDCFKCFMEKFISSNQSEGKRAGKIFTKGAPEVEVKRANPDTVRKFKSYAKVARTLPENSEILTNFHDGSVEKLAASTDLTKEEATAFVKFRAKQLFDKAGPLPSVANLLHKHSNLLVILES